MTDPLDALTAALADRYRLERELGAGGMATVYLAHDLKHDRKVAIKVLRPELAAVIGAERFLSEIKTTANLQHPHILPLFDSGVAGTHLFYVMPFIEGESLRDRLTREVQLPIADAVRIASEVASALDYAHRHNVIHRDIKPENILLHDGRALVADFGIALAASKAGGTRMTETGMSLGTPTYMSPEQAMGEREITARSDVYALGAMTYEMLLGEPPFTGPTAQSIVAKVMTEKPGSLVARRERVPPAVEVAVHTALEKLPADRFATAAEFAQALVAPVTVAMPAGAAPLRARRGGWLLGAAGVALGLLAGVLIGRGRRADPGSVAPGDVVRATLDLGDSAAIQSMANIRMAISPSGRQVVYAGPERGDASLWLRDLDQPRARPLADTKGGFGAFYSPDGGAIGFFTSAGGGRVALRVVALAGGVARTVVDSGVVSFGSGAWGDDGNIYFTNASRGLSRVPATGGAVTEVSRVDSTTPIREHDFPDILPGSKRAVVMLWMGSPVINHVGLVDLTTGEVTDLVPGTFARYLAPGYLIVGAIDGRLSAVRFDAATGKLRGTPVAVLQGVQGESNNGTIQFAVSRSGTLVYQGGGGALTTLVWVDRAGRMVPVDSGLAGGFLNVALSPDGGRIALDRADQGDGQVWVKQLASGAFTRLSFGVSAADRPVWSPDGHRVAFMASRDSRRTAWIARSDGSDSVRPASPGPTRLDEIAFDPLGRYTLYRSEGAGQGSRRLLIVRNGVDTAPRLLLSAPGDQYAPTLAPDGRWLAYVSTESGLPEVYVRPFPSVDSARYTISVGGGTEPVWRRDGKELFFRDLRGGVSAVTVTTGARFERGPPRPLFSIPDLLQQEFHRAYDVSLDGARFLMLKGGGSGGTRLQAILNWRAELERLVPATP